MTTYLSTWPADDLTTCGSSSNSVKIRKKTTCGSSSNSVKIRKKDWIKKKRKKKKRQAGAGIITSCMNFLQTGRISLDRVAENIITCFECGVARKIS